MKLNQDELKDSIVKTNIIHNDNGLIKSLFLKLIPPLLLMYIFLYISNQINSVILGNFIGQEAFATVNLFQPISNFIAALNGFLSGILYLIPKTIGENDCNGKMSVLKASMIFTVIIMIIIIIVQPVLINILASQYSERDLILTYSIPYYYINVLVTISTFATNILIAYGNTKTLLYLTIIEVIFDVIFSYLFVAILNFGIIGASYGTLVATIIRVILSVWQVNKLIDIFDVIHYKMKNIEIIQSITEIIKYGLPASVICITLAIQINYLNNTIILFFAREGIIVNSINTMIYNLAIMFFAAVTSAVTPIFSLLKGAKDIDNFNKCLKMLTFIILIIGFVFTFVAIFAYELFYKICGIDIIPSFAQTSILIFSIIFIPKGLNTVTKMFLTVDHKVKIVSLMTVFEMSLLPLLFAQVLFRIEPILIYMTYGLSELVIAIFSCIYCKVNIDKQNMNDKNTIRLSFSVNKDNLYETSSYVIDFLKKNSVSDKAAYKAGLAIEEMYEYIPQQGKNINNHILIFLDGGDVVFHMIHNGVNLHLDTLKKASKDNIICNNYKLIYSLADKFDFQYLMSLNNITLRFKNI